MKLSPSILVAVVALSALGGCGDEVKPVALTIPVDVQTKTITKEDAEKAVAIFIEQCKPLTSLPAGDIVSAKATAQGTYDYQVKRHGWTSGIEIVVKISDSPSIRAVEAGAMGHNLFYFLGGGPDAGIDARKRPSQKLCGMIPNEDGKDVFKPVPALSFLK